MARGRKPLFREDMIRQAELFGALDLELKDVADVFGITPATLCRYQKNHPQLKQAYERGRTKLKDLIGRKFIKKIEEENWDAIKEGLKHVLKWKDPLIDQSTHVTFNILAEKLQEARERRLRGASLPPPKP